MDALALAKILLSTSNVFNPALLASIAALTPPSPLPMTRTSHFSFTIFMMLTSDSVCLLKRRRAQGGPVVKIVLYNRQAQGFTK
jgi:hypothetical protein